MNNAAAVETTFERIRRRYAIYFYLPDGMEMRRGMELDLTEMALLEDPELKRFTGNVEDSFSVPPQ